MAELTLDLIKHKGPTTADIMAPQIITDFRNFTLDIKQLGFGLPPDSGTLISKWKAKLLFTFIWKEDFGPLSNSPVLFLLSPGKMLLTMFLFLKWLGSPFPEDVWAWWLLMHWLQLQFTPCEALPSVWISFAWLYSQACVHPCCLFHRFLPNFFLPVNFAFNMLWYSTPWRATSFSNEPLWLTLFVEGVNDRLLEHCQVSSVLHYCAFKEQEIPRIYTVWMIINWNSNVNIQKLWDTGFLIFMSCKLESSKLKTFEMFYITCNESKIYESFTSWK